MNFQNWYDETKFLCMQTQYKQTACKRPQLISSKQLSEDINLDKPSLLSQNILHGNLPYTLSSSDAVYSHFSNCDTLLQLEKKYGLTRIYIRCSHDAPLKRTAHFISSTLY